MHAKPSVKVLRANKQQAKLLYKAEADLEKEVDKQLDIIMHSAAIALNKYHSWNAEQINDFVAHKTQDLWNECAKSTTLSMVQMLADETGIELMSEDKAESYENIIYLNSEIDDGRDLDIYQWIAMRQNQKKWVAVQIMAVVLLTLYRNYHWKDEALGKLFKHIEEIKQQYGASTKGIKQLKTDSYNVVGFVITNDLFKVTKDGEIA